MSYCVNCGVELDQTATKCPLCDTPVINPGELEQLRQAMQPFPRTKGEVETVKRKDVGILFSVILLSIAVTCGILNGFVFKGSLWSLIIIGVCAVFWVMLIPALINHRQSVYLSLLLDGMAVFLYLYLLTYLTGSSEWLLRLGLPIVVLVTVVAELFTVCVRVLPKSYLTIALYLVLAVGILCAGLEILIDLFVSGKIDLSWSAVVMTICVVLTIAIITMLSRRRLRNAVRRRLHF